MSEYYHPRYSGRKSRKHFRGPLLFVLLVLVLLVSGAAWVAYMGLYRQNVYTGEAGSVSSPSLQEATLTVSESNYTLMELL